MAALRVPTLSSFALSAVSLEDWLRSSYPSLEAALSGLAPPAGVLLKYGTAGFRARAELLDSTFLRMGVLAALRSRFHRGAAVGLMVTASHNAEPDNGIKMVDADGGMLAQAWEGAAQSIANASGGSEIAAIAEAIQELFADDDDQQLGRLLTAGSGGGPAVVMLGRDTRPHSPRLAALAAQGAALVGATVRDMEVVTTPQLHHIVRMTNVASSSSSSVFGVRPADAAEWASEDGYYHMLAGAFRRLIATAPQQPPAATGGLFIDGACGVGAAKFPLLLAALAERQPISQPPSLVATVLNKVGEGPLNGGCGAEHVQKGRCPPSGMDRGALAGERLCSFDGDADRLVYHFWDKNTAAAAAAATDEHGGGGGGGGGGSGQGGGGGGEGESLVSGWHLLDGDKIATLFADFIQEAVRAVPCLGTGCSIGVVQTAYANGASSDYLRGIIAQSGAAGAAGAGSGGSGGSGAGKDSSSNSNSNSLQLDFAKTGVKFVHHVAEQYDIGIYFEANGHGTAIFKGHVIDRLRQRQQELLREAGAGQQGALSGKGEGEEAVAVERLLSLWQLVNQAVGDAMSDALAVEAILIVRGWGLAEWDALYQDLPSRQSKLPVKDRAAVRCIPDETKVEVDAPPGLQARLDECMGRVAGGRCFVRPSGTEDVVRVYAEAPTQGAADDLAHEAAKAVFELAGGVGVPP